MSSCRTARLPSSSRTGRLPRTAYAVGAVLLLSTVVPTGVPAAATADTSVTPPAAAAAAAESGAAWLAEQLADNGGYVTGFDGEPSVGDTADAVLALYAAAPDGALAAAPALVWLQQQATTVEEPGVLAKLILVADAAGMDPTDFAGADGDEDDLVARLLDTQRTSGRDAGLFGEADPANDGAFRQGLALLALSTTGGDPAGDDGTDGGSEDTATDTATEGTAAGDAVGLQPAVEWLTSQQCENGAWQPYRLDVGTDCGEPDPAAFSGPDTNSTALAVSGLAATAARQWEDRGADQRVGLDVEQHVKQGLDWLADHAAPDGGWSFHPGPQAASDPNSTAVVVQALIAGGREPAPAAFDRLLDFHLDEGPFWFDLGDGTRTPNVPATTAAVPAAAGRAFPLSSPTADGAAADPTPGAARAGDPAQEQGSAQDQADDGAGTGTWMLAGIAGLAVVIVVARVLPLLLARRSRRGTAGP